MSLIDNWQHAWRMRSFQLAVLVPVVNAVLYYLPQLGVSPFWLMVINCFAGVGIAYARIIKQPELATAENFNEKL